MTPKIPTRLLMCLVATLTTATGCTSSGGDEPGATSSAPAQNAPAGPVPQPEPPEPSTPATPDPQPQPQPPAPAPPSETEPPAPTPDPEPELDPTAATPLPPGAGSAPTQGAEDDGFLTAMTAAFSGGYVTLNERWTQADLDYENIGVNIDYAFRAGSQPRGRVRPYTTLYHQYRVRRAQCVEDSNNRTAEGEPVCFPTLVTAVNPINSRYGYYCGYNHPSHGAFFQQTPEPLDGVDYCCRLHDQQVWGTAADERESECGIAMCLSKASGSPSNVLDRMPAMEEARQFWYDWSSLACGGNQSNDAQPPLPP